MSPTHGVSHSRGWRTSRAILALGAGACLAAPCCPPCPSPTAPACAPAPCPATAPGTEAASGAAPSGRDDCISASPAGEVVVDVRRRYRDCPSDVRVDVLQEGEIRWTEGPSSGTCDWELAAFSRGRGMFDTVATVQGSTAEAAAVTRPLPEQVRIPVSVWILTDAAGAAEHVDVDLAEASRLLDTSRVGLRLETVEVDTVDADARGALLAPPCTVSEVTWTKPDRYYSDATLNVYVVDALAGGALGYQCFPQARNSPYPSNIIHLSLSLHPEWVLAHEIAHALSLRRVNVEDEASYRDCGHTYDGVHERPECGCIGENNIMWDHGDLFVTRDRFTLGQAFRMNVDSLSWIQRAKLDGVVRARGCQADCFADGCRASRPCIRIDLDYWRPSP